MTFRLKQLTVENFRSIRGRATVDLNAPIVLIHGPNGVGKTSLLSAIELGLTGDVAALSRGDEGFQQHLVHKDSPNGLGSVDLTVSRVDGATHAHVQLSAAGIDGAGLLSSKDAEFFSNRCYLAQSTLGRLFEVYQSQDARRSDTALTKFVRDLLRLDSLDALIDGLIPVGNVSRLRNTAPQFYMARADLPTLQGNLGAAESDVKRLEAELQTLEADIRALSADVWPADRPIEPEGLVAELSSRRLADDRELTDLAGRRREVAVIRAQVAAYATTDAGAQRVAAEQAVAEARAASSAWVTGDGQKLASVLQAMQAKYAEVPPVENGAEAAHASALTLLAAEIKRVERVIAGDAANATALAAVEADIFQGQARLGQIDRELVGLAEANQDLASALASLVPHIHTEDCPVCGRDFKEVSEQPLAARLSVRIAELTETAGRLEALSRDRSSSAAAVATATRRADELHALLLAPEALATLKRELAQLEEWHNALAALAEAARAGTRFQLALMRAERDLAELNSRDSALSGNRQQLADQAAFLQLSTPESQETAEVAAVRLLAEIERRAEVMAVRQDRLRRGEDLVRQIAGRRAALESARTAAQARRRRFEALSAAKKEADRRIDLAKDLADVARRRRTAIVSQVFNNELNTVWRDLFIRLAPEEDFVPRFKLPYVGAGRVEAELETIYRTGGLGGDPRAMLSAGNLNTAALTLFLALHLSVPATLPLLIIDDPVQSMDEVHVSQFAALLRTLKSANRQVVIAIHERALFDYLTLELSPAFNGDQLITIELTRALGGDTRPIWDLKSFKIDEAIAA
jgi:exonuclease SbcC